MEIWDRNLEALRLKDPALADLVLGCEEHAGLTVEPAKNGEPVAKRNGVFLHSSYDPSREAAGWLENNSSDPGALITVLGLGLGYHVKALAEAGCHGAFIEPDPALFRLALKHLDLTRVLEQFQPFVAVSREKLQRAHRDLLAGRTVVHPASLQTNPDYFQKLADFADALAVVRKGGLKILLVNPVYGGSLPAAHHCAAALGQMGHEVQVYAAEAFAAGMEFTDSFTQEVNRKSFLNRMCTFLAQGVEMKAREYQPDLIIALAQAPLQNQSLARLEGMGIPTAFWFVEDHRVLPYWREVAASYSYFFAIQKGEFPVELDKCGVRHHAYLPTAAAPEVHAPLDLSNADREEFGSPLSFVGAGYYNRQRSFRGLIDYPFKIWGSDWPQLLPLAPFIQRGAARIDTATCVKIFNASAINLNLHSSSIHEGVDPTGDFINPRTFEIASCNAFQLVDKRSLMTGMFAEGELEIFSSMAELRDKIDHFLANPEARRVIAANGRKRVLAEHTYEARMEELLALMVGAFPVIGDKLSHRREKQDSFVAEMKRLDGMDKVLARIPQGSTVRLPDIYRAIDNGSGDLSRAEKIFLMLRNVEIVQGAGT